MGKIARQRGFSLLELAMVMGVIAVMAVTAIQFFNGASDSRKTMEVAKGITSITTILRNQYASQGNYNGIDISTLVTASNFPRIFEGANANEMNHYWGANSFTITAEDVDAVDDGFSIEIDDLPVSVCVDLATQLWNDYVSFEVGANIIGSSGDVGAACQEADNDIRLVAK